MPGSEEERAAIAHRLGVFFQLTEEDHRKLCWFEMSGDDFYWGPAEEGRDIAPIEFSGESLTIAVPEDLEALRRCSGRPRTTPRDTRTRQETACNRRRTGGGAARLTSSSRGASAWS